MSISAIITSESKSCTLNNLFAVSEYMFDIGFTFIDDDASDILNNRISLSCSEVPNDVMIAIDPYGRIIAKTTSTVDFDSIFKLVVNNNGVLFEKSIAVGQLLTTLVGESLEFTEGGEGGEGGGAETPSTSQK